MTLIIGALCSDGIFMCSDTEEGTALGNKAVRKLRRLSGDSWHMAFGSAGFGPICDVALQRVSNAARGAGDNFIVDYEKVIGSEMAKLYDQYLHYSLPDQVRYDRQISLVICLFNRQTKEASLYRTDEEILQPVSEPYACVGSGKGIADYYLERLFRDFRAPLFSGCPPRIHEAERLLQFVMKEAKQSVGGVGGNTDTVNIHFDGGIGDGTFGVGWDGKQPQLRDLMQHFWLDDPKPKQ